MGDNAKAVEVSTIPVTGQPFTDAMRLTIKEASTHEWAVQLQTPTTAPVAMGDAILATFWFRTETPQEGSVGETEFVFELGRSPYSKSVQYPIQAGPDWTRVQVRFNADGDLRGRRGQHDLPPRLRPADDRSRRREGRELRQGDRDGRAADVA